ncbi:MAG: NAD(P)H-quinone oxidoreductase [Gemmatimonadetes bacterium]|jgi:NADPH:quinone reductase|nr:NAD(P)H-quinone oxidoreductase [Gemmatimonadota bacterium]
MNKSMKAVVIREHGDADVLEIREVPRPEPGPGEILVRVATSGVNRADLLQRRGRYPVPAGYPEDILGLEYAGTVEKAASDVSESLGAPGLEVMGITGGGAYAQYVVVPATTAVAIPQKMTVADAGAIPEVFMTAFDAVFLQEELTAGETLLVHAAGSGVGTAAIQLAHRAGARTVGTSRTADKLAQALRLGLDFPVVGDDAWPERVLEITNGRGVDVILDLVGGPYLAGNQSVLAAQGRHVVVGVPGGPKAEIDLRALMARRGSIRGTVLRARPLAEKEALARAFERDVLPGFNNQELRPVIDSIFPAAEAAQAHRRVESNGTFGKVLLEW